MNNLSIESQIQELDEWIRSIQMPESKVKQELEAKLDYWLEQATNSVGGSVLGYKTKKDGVTVGLLEEPG